jgi:hypothetical protein
MMAFWTQTLQSLFQVEALLGNLESSKNPFKLGQLTRASFSPPLCLVHGRDPPKSYQISPMILRRAGNWSCFDSQMQRRGKLDKVNRY